MPKEVLIYGGINSLSATDFINSVNDGDTDADLTVRINTPGGDVLSGWGMIAKFKEYTGKKSVKVDGSAYSMGLFFAAYADNVEALDVSQFLLHRAAYPSWYEQDYMSDAERTNLENINKSLAVAIKNKIDVAKFEEIKGIKLADIFSMDDRKDVFLTAQEAKKIGLINKIEKITPEKKSAISADMVRIAAQYDFKAFSNPAESNNKEAQPGGEAVNVEEVEQKQKKMTKSELLAQHPELAAELQNDAVSAERDRVGAWMAFNEVDPKAVAEGISSGKNITETARSEFAIKMASANVVKTVTGEAAPPVKVDARNADAAEPTASEKFEASVAAQLGINTEKK